MIERSKTEINLDHFEYNLSNILKFKNKNSRFLQIVKADAYGHGAYQIALKAIELGAKILGVANSEEGIFLRYQGISIPILILSPSLESEIEDIVNYNLTPTISDLIFIKKLSDYLEKKDKKISVHINIDTGMGRSGFSYSNFKENIPGIFQFKNVVIEGIFSHFAASENDKEFTDLQILRFKNIVSDLPYLPKYIHIANSSGIINTNCDFCNLVRIGILSFGIYPDKRLKSKIYLKPVMRFISYVSQIKKAKNGDSIGYNRLYKVKNNLTYAIIPIGYADGLEYLLSDKGFVMINQKICPIIGKISMDMTAIDVSNVDCKIGDKVDIISDKNEKLFAENITALYKGNPYELLCQVGRRAKRYYFSNNKLLSTQPLLRRDFVSKDFNDEGLNKIISTAISQRLKSDEISSVIYANVLRKLFYDSDNQISYRSQFHHTIEFIDENPENDFYVVKTKLSFRKKLINENFMIVCANNNQSLQRYFLDPKVEYRWLLHNNFVLDKDSFSIERVAINNIELIKKYQIDDKLIKINCTHPKLKMLRGSVQEYSISTLTKYPKNSHQLSVYINEITKSFQIEFIYPENLTPEIVPIFAGKTKFPKINKTKNKISVSSQIDEWIFPNSGIVFSY